MAATVLLTGATGYIGSRLLRLLEEGGVSVRCVARQPVRWMVRHQGYIPGRRFCDGQVRGPSFLWRHGL